MTSREICVAASLRVTQLLLVDVISTEECHNILQVCHKAI